MMKSKLFEIYTDGNALHMLTQAKYVDKILEAHPGWYAKRISLVDALVKYGIKALSSERYLQSHC